MNFFSDNENFERGPPRHAGGNGNQGINFVWPYTQGRSNLEMRLGFPM